MPTFRIQTLGCKVNQYESQQMAQLLRSRGWEETAREQVDLVIVHTCSVTTASAGKSRQAARKAAGRSGARVYTVATGCWASLSPQEARAIPRLSGAIASGELATGLTAVAERIERELAGSSEARREAGGEAVAEADASSQGTAGLPLLSARQPSNQRALLKVQDGCDACCSYCIVPTLRPRLWSKPLQEAVEEARRLVAAGHLEIVLTGIFLGAYAQPTALHRRQQEPSALPRLVEALCTQVPGLRRLRLSSLEPADLGDELLRVLASQPAAVPHFHLPLQSGSDAILRRMNRQYTRELFLERVERLRELFDRPAITTDIICGFPGESEADFAATLEVARQARFIHIHAFPFSPRPGTAAARWKTGRVPQRIAGERVRLLDELAAAQSVNFRKGFIGEEVELLVEGGMLPGGQRHGRCERYFDVAFDAAGQQAGELVRVQVQRVEGERTIGTVR